MIMEKYKGILFQKIKEQLKKWFETDLNLTIANEEVYRFLHSIKGTAGTIDLLGLHQLAGDLMEKIEEESEYEWSRDELSDFLYELIGLSYEYEHFHVDDPLEKQDMLKCEQTSLIQIIDDDISMIILLKDALEARGWMVIANTDPIKATTQFFDYHPDCLIIDINLPNESGLSLLETFDSFSQKKFIPKIMISINNSRENRIHAYRHGADDFIEKPIDMEEFIVRVERQLTRKQMFEQSVLKDELTQVYNRKFLQDSLQRSLNDITRTGTYFSIALLDLDHFKKINDTCGHLAGDRILVRFTQFIKENIRSTDILFRYGGEEFIIVFPDTTDHEASIILTKLLEEFSGITFTEKGLVFSVTFSAGVYMVTNGNLGFLETINIADQALYRAKHKGRARVISANTLENIHQKKTLFVSVIDDDAIIRMMLMKVIRSIQVDGYELDVEVFEDGQQFFKVKRNEENGSHFVILDGVMPVMDGNEVLKKIKQGDNADQFQVLMLTGRKSESDIAKAIRLGADDYVTKPFNVNDLIIRIERFLHHMI